MAPDGSFAVAYENTDLDGTARLDVSLGLFDAQAEGLQEYTPLNIHTDSEQDHVSVAAAGSHGYVAIWRSLFQDGDGDGVFARRFLGPLATDATEFQVPSSATGWQAAPAIGANDEIVVMVWRQTGPIGDFELWAKVMPVLSSPTP